MYTTLPRLAPSCWCARSIRPAVETGYVGGPSTHLLHSGLQFQSVYFKRQRGSGSPMFALGRTMSPGWVSWLLVSVRGTEQAGDSEVQMEVRGPAGHPWWGEPCRGQVSGRWRISRPGAGQGCTAQRGSGSRVQQEDTPSSLLPGVLKPKKK